MSSRASHENSGGRDDYHRGSMTRTYPEKEYHILCVSNLNHRVGDATVREGVLREFKKFGDVEVKLIVDGGERLVYAYFRTPEDAREARHAKNKLVLYDKPILVEPVYETADKPPPPPRGGRPPRASVSPDLHMPYPPSKSSSARPPRGLSPTHSTSSSSSLQRRSGHSNSHELHHHGEGGPFAPGHPDFLSPPGNRHREDKKEKFPNYLHHIAPEDDAKANRTLFVGNLEVNIVEPEVRRIFERFGVVEDIDIKRPPPGQGNAYAFVKFLNLDMAHKSKVEMSGQYIGKFQCKIGYGKPIPTTRIWVGGLGPWTSLSHLEREFDRFGAIKKIDFVKGDNHAYILYDSIDAAQAACKEMRGFPLGGPSKRLRVDFADAGPYNYHQNASGGGSSQPAAAAQTQRHNTYSVEEENYYRQRVDHEHSGMRGTSRDPYYYGSSRDDYRWGSSGSYYDPYYERGGGRGRIHDDWAGAGYEREHRHQDDHVYGGSWGEREYGSWRDNGGGRTRDEWPASEHRPRKRPRSPDDLHYEIGGRGGLDHQDVAPAYRGRYPRQRTPPEGHLDSSPPHVMHTGRRRKSPSPPLPRNFRSRDQSRERDMTPPGRPPGGGTASMRDRHMTRNRDGLPDRDRSLRSVASMRDDGRSENGGRQRGDSSGGPRSSPSRLLLPPLVPEAQADRLLRSGTLTEVARIIPCTWQGGLVLKNSFFPVSMHACEGDAHIVDQLTKDASSSEQQVLRITQRLRLDQPKLDDVAKRLTGGGFCIFLGVAPSEDQPQPLPGGALVQQRPLRNLVSYLKQKEAAGVIALAGTKESQGVLYAFPPCRFSQERMRRVAPGLTEEGLKEDHLVIAVVRGAI